MVDTLIFLKVFLGLSYVNIVVGLSHCKEVICVVHPSALNCSNDKQTATQQLQKKALLFKVVKAFFKYNKYESQVG